ncbi:DMT family transporter [Lactococcus garvieae]|uniref:DMT family transporter n=1 Tax=Lactococcus garvieae TaxID=1363 RepID=UPI00324E09DE
MEKQNYLLGVTLCLISTIFWGAMFPVMTPALKVIDPFYFTLFRYGSVAIIFGIILLIMEGKKSFQFEGQGIKLWLLGTFAFAGFSFLVFLGQKLAGVSGSIIASVMMAIQPLLAVLVNRVWRGVKPSKVALISMLFAIIGVLLVVTDGDVNKLFTGDNLLLATLFMLVGALCWVIYSSGGSDFKEWSILRFSALTTLLGMVSVVVIITITTLAGCLELPTVSMIEKVSPELLYMVFPAGVIAVFTWNYGNRIAGPINAILFMNVVPVTAFIINALLGYQIGFWKILGAVIVIGALIANNLYNRKSL